MCFSLMSHGLPYLEVMAVIVYTNLKMNKGIHVFKIFICEGI